MGVKADFALMQQYFLTFLATTRFATYSSEQKSGGSEMSVSEETRLECDLMKADHASRQQHWQYLQTVKIGLLTGSAAIHATLAGLYFNALSFQKAQLVETMIGFQTLPIFRYAEIDPMTAMLVSGSGIVAAAIMLFVELFTEVLIWDIVPEGAILEERLGYKGGVLTSIRNRMTRASRPLPAVPVVLTSVMIMVLCLWIYGLIDAYTYLPKSPWR